MSNPRAMRLFQVATLARTVLVCRRDVSRIVAMICATPNVSKVLVVVAEFDDTLTSRTASRIVDHNGVTFKDDDEEESDSVLP